MDLDCILQTESLPNKAAMHKKSVRPKHRQKTRRVSMAPSHMVRYSMSPLLNHCHMSHACVISTSLGHIVIPLHLHIILAQSHRHVFASSCHSMICGDVTSHFCVVTSSCCHTSVSLQPSLAEKKTLEIAHTFPDNGTTISSSKVYEPVKPSPVTIRKEGEVIRKSPADKVV